MPRKALYLLLILLFSITFVQAQSDAPAQLRVMQLSYLPELGSASDIDLDASVIFENIGWQVIAGILAACGETLSTEHPTVDCTLDDGTRVHATYAPLLLTLDKRGSEQEI